MLGCRERTKLGLFVVHLRLIADPNMYICMVEHQTACLVPVVMNQANNVPQNLKPRWSWQQFESFSSKQGSIHAWWRGNMRSVDAGNGRWWERTLNISLLEPAKFQLWSIYPLTIVLAHTKSRYFFLSRTLTIPEKIHGYVPNGSAILSQLLGALQ